LHDCYIGANLFRLLLLCLRLTLLFGDLGLDQGLLPLVGELNVDDLDVGAFSKNFIQLSVDGITDLVTRRLPLRPEGGGVEVSHNLSRHRVNVGHVGDLVSLLELGVKMAHILLLKAVLDREGETNFLTVVILHHEWFTLGIWELCEINVDQSGGEGDKRHHWSNEVPPSRVDCVGIHRFGDGVIYNAVLDGLDGTYTHQHDDEGNQEPAYTTCN
jgi:hypothetical protein